MVTGVEAYFEGWTPYIDAQKVYRALQQVMNLPDVCPANPKDILRVFRVCKCEGCRVVMLFQDPYPQEGVATGIAVGNWADTPEDLISPSLQVVKEAVVDYTIPHNNITFDNTLESWCQQGVLMLNTALTCRIGKVGCHYTVWEPVISDFIQRFSSARSGLVWVLFGSQAKAFKEDIKGFQHIITVNHPAYYARTNQKMPNVFAEVNKILKEQNNEQIKFYDEI